MKFDSIDWSAVATFSAALVALGIGVVSVRQSNKTQKKQYRCEQLKEITSWAISIHTTPLDVKLPEINVSHLREIELTGAVSKTVVDALKADLINQIDTPVEYQQSMSYGRALAYNEYIRAIVTTSFKRQLLTEVDAVINDLVSLSYLKKRSDSRTSSGVTNAFQGTYSQIVNKLDTDINGGKDAGQLLAEFENHIAVSINKLLEKITKTINNLYPHSTSKCNR